MKAIRVVREAKFAAVTLASLILICVLAFTVFAGDKQNEDKKTKAEKTKPQPQVQVREEPDPFITTPVVPVNDNQAIDIAVGQMLAAWQIGDMELLHSFYAEDVLVVSGAWEPPLQGWQNYSKAYQSQRARTQLARLDRTDTFIKVDGNAAMCTYKWEFYGQVDGGQSSAFGHTTLFLEKRAGKWVIVLNHTSIVPSPERPAQSSTVPVDSNGAKHAAAVPAR